MDPNFGKIPEGFDKVWVKRKVNDTIKQIRNDSKPKKCIICGRPISSTCNSHSVPRMCLVNIADKGNVLQANGLLGTELIDVTKGVNNSGTFHFICNECDNTLFQDYESPEKIASEELPDKTLAEIALKDVLLMLSKRNFEKELYRKAGERGNIEGLETMFTIKNLDERDFQNEMELYLGIDEKAVKNFHVVYHEILPYTTPIAVQTALVIEKDLEGRVINDIYNLSEDIRIQNIHISVFPLKNQTVVLMFYHRRDKNYRQFSHQFRSLSKEEQLRYINYYIFKFTENYFFSPKIQETLKGSPKLVQLSRENNELPNLGYITMEDILQGYEPVKMEEIPNILSSKYAL